MNTRYRMSLFLVALLYAGSASATYTKIANSGVDLPDSAVLGSGPTDWACTRDNATGLTWEVKTDDDGLRDKDTTYTNYDSFYGTTTQINAASNSVGFSYRVNDTGLCGSTEWRMPSLDELEALYPNHGNGYFPNTSSSNFWSGSPYAGSSSSARSVNFFDGNASFNYRFFNYRVRLVRGGQSFATFGLAVSITGWGAGTVNTGGIACNRLAGVTSGTCSAERGQNALVTLTATPASGSTFLGWGGACSGSATTCSITMNQAQSVTADFYRPTAITAIIAAPNAPATLYAGIDGGGVYKKLGEGSWTSIIAGLTNLNVKALAIQPDGTLFAGTDGGGVFKTSDGGANWSLCGAMANAAIRSLLVVGGTLYAGSTDGVAKSTDNCASWTDFSTGLPTAP